jgi:hypothetical protein
MTQVNQQPFIVVYIGIESPDLVRSEELSPKPYLPRNDFVQQYLQICNLNIKINLIEGKTETNLVYCLCTYSFQYQKLCSVKGNDNYKFQECESQWSWPV